MITGEVNAFREAVVRLRVLGPDDRTADVDAVLDTGFTEHLTLPPELVPALGMPYLDTSRMLLGDHSVASFPIHLGRIIWQEQVVMVAVHVADGQPLLGMGQLLGCHMSMHVVDGGEVKIETD